MSRRGLNGDVGQLLRTTRELRGLSQARLAELTGVSQQRVSKLERGVVDARLGDLERLFDGMRLRLRVEAVPAASSAVEDPELVVGLPEAARVDAVGSHCHLLGKLHDVPHMVGGRLAAFALGLPVRVRRLDLLVAEDDRELLTGSLHRFSTQRWSERWQAFCNDTPPHRPDAVADQRHLGAAGRAGGGPAGAGGGPAGRPAAVGADVAVAARQRPGCRRSARSAHCRGLVRPAAWPAAA